jgi:hypothetical protein
MKFGGVSSKLKSSLMLLMAHRMLIAEDGFSIGKVDGLVTWR